jgi:hypothetical protein
LVAGENSEHFAAPPSSADVSRAPTGLKRVSLEPKPLGYPLRPSLTWRKTDEPGVTTSKLRMSMEAEPAYLW